MWLIVGLEDCLVDAECDLDGVRVQIAAWRRPAGSQTADAARCFPVQAPKCPGRRAKPARIV
jgi:hypothetical protein